MDGAAAAVALCGEPGDGQELCVARPPQVGLELGVDGELHVEAVVVDGGEGAVGRRELDLRLKSGCYIGVTETDSPFCEKNYLKLIVFDLITTNHCFENDHAVIPSLIKCYFLLFTKFRWLIIDNTKRKREV